MAEAFEAETKDELDKFFDEMEQKITKGSDDKESSEENEKDKTKKKNKEKERNFRDEDYQDYKGW